jgi:hypothetical protein
MTSHNDKLGYDWSVAHGGIFVGEPSLQFKSSGYNKQDFVTTAASATEAAVRMGWKALDSHS